MIKRWNIVDFNEGHLAQIVRIEKHNFSDPWKPEEFVAFKSLRGHQIIVSMALFSVVGYACVSGDVEISNLSVHPEWRRQRIGSQIIEALKKRAGRIGKGIDAVVSEFNLPGQLFFQSQRFSCASVQKNHYGIKNHDAYQMVWKSEKVTSP